MPAAFQPENLQVRQKQWQQRGTNDGDRSYAKTDATEQQQQQALCLSAAAAMPLTRGCSALCGTMRIGAPPNSHGQDPRPAGRKTEEGTNLAAPSTEPETIGTGVQCVAG